MGNLAVVDFVVVGLYFAFCIGLGIYSKFKKKGDKGETAEGYFLAGRSMLWWAVGGSLFSSNIGSEHFIGLAGSGAAAGIGVVAYEWQASWILLLLGYFFVPIYLRAKVFTMPQFLKMRFQSKWMRFYLTIVSLLSYITTKISVDMYAGGVFLKEAMGWNIYVSSAIILTITAIYTLLGGLTAVIYTDVLQCFIMICGAISLSAIGFSKLGGYSALWEQFSTATGESILSNQRVLKNITMLVNATVIPTLAGGATASPLTTFYNVTMEKNVTIHHGAVSNCYKVPSNWGHMFRSLDDPEYPWIGLWLSLPVTGIWYWCTDQVIVQRTLGAKNILHARAGTILAGCLKILPMYIMVMPGMISRVLYKDVVGCADPASCEKYCGNKYGCSNTAYPKLVLNALPSGAVGLMLAVMMAALMSSLSSAFNSASTIFTVDVWKLIRPKASDREQLIVGRVVVACLVVIGVIWIPIVSTGHGGQLFKYLQTIQSYLAPPACAVFLIGISWPRATEAGALTSMIIGLILGGTRLIMDVVYPQPHCGEIDDRPGFVKLHFMYYAIIIFTVCVFLIVVISLFTKPVPLEDLGALTWATINKPRYRGSSSGKSAEYIVSSDAVEIGKLKHIDAEIPGEDKKGLTVEISGATPQREEKEPKRIENGSLDKDELTEHEEELAEIRAFEHQPFVQKWVLRGLTIGLLVVLAILWIVYR